MKTCEKCKNHDPEKGVCRLWGKLPPEGYAEKCKRYEFDEDKKNLPDNTLKCSQSCQYFEDDGCWINNNTWRSVAKLTSCRVKDGVTVPEAMTCKYCNRHITPEVHLVLNKLICPSCHRPMANIK